MNVFMARQPIFDFNNQTYGYELLFRNNAVDNKSGVTFFDGDKATGDVITNAFFDLHTNSILSGKRAFINFTASLIKKGIPKLLPADAIVVEILEDVDIDDELIVCIVELKEMGYTIALDDFAFEESRLELFQLADIVKIDFRMANEIVMETAYMCRYANKVILAEKVEDENDLELAKLINATYVQGYFFAKPTMIVKKTMAPLANTFIQILNQYCSLEPDMDELSDIISADAALVAKLLKLVNTVYYSSKNRVSSVKQAITLLGLETLEEWIYIISMNQMLDNKPSELLKLSFIRAKFCEEVTLNLVGGAGHAKSVYLMGLISLLDAFTDMPMETILDDLPVSQFIKDGILRRKSGNIYTVIYRLCYAYERGDWPAVDYCSSKIGLDISILANCYLVCTEYVDEFWSSIA